MIKEYQLLAQSILDIVSDGIVTIDQKGTILLVNPATEKIFGYSKEELIGENVSVLMPSPFSEQHDAYIQRYLETGERHIIGIGREIFGKKKNGDMFPVRLSVGEIRVDGNVSFVGILRDISEKVQLKALTLANRGLHENISEATEDKKRLETALREKEILLKEVHHRVKNNLQLITSMLNLRMKKPGRYSPEELIQDVSNRIYSISVLYGLLYQGDKSNIVCAKEYLDKVIESQISSLGLGRGIKIVSNIENVLLEPGQSICCALIINELITNAVKHAFTSEKDGEINISLSRNGDEINLVVQDNGKGIEESQNKNTLGLDLTNMLAQKIHGKLVVSGTNGTIANLSFPAFKIRDA